MSEQNSRAFSGRCNIHLHNGDCMDALRAMPNKCFELAIVDPPYGIGENGDRNASRGKLAVAKDYKPFAGGDVSAQTQIILMNCKGFLKTKSYGGATTLLITSHLVAPPLVGLSGTRLLENLTLPTQKWRGHHSKLLSECLNSNGAECFKAI